jgi:hypothetical protein
MAAPVVGKSPVPDADTAEEAWREFERVRQCIQLLVLETQMGESSPSNGEERITKESLADRLATVHEDCANVELDVRKIQALLKRAAELGSMDARVAYASSPELVPAHMNAEIEAWQHWRDHAPAYLDEAIAGGNGEAAMLRGVASMRRDCNIHGGIDGRDGDDAICHRSFPLNAILPRDDIAAYAHLLLARQFGVGAHAAELDALLTSLAARMTAEQRAQAEQLMQTLRAGVCCRS